MRATGTARGFSLIEVLVAIVLLSTMALALTHTLLAAQRAQAASARWTRATQLAAEGLERLRAGHSLGSVPDGVTRTGAATQWSGPDDLVQVTVTVAWNDGAPRAVRLSTLVRR